MEPWILPEPVIVEDAPCEMCDERGLPHDEADQEAYCATHQMEWETGVALEDYTNGAGYLRDEIINEVHNPQATDSGRCACIGCQNEGVSRLTEDGLMALCIQCAANLAFPAELMDKDTWVVILADEILDP